MLARVSNIDAFRRWRDWSPRFEGDEEPTLADLVRSIVSDEPSEAMQVGTAFHKAMENASEGIHDNLSANGYTFMLHDGIVELPPIREMRTFKDYGALTVTGQVDAVHGRLVIDHKTTSRIDFERYLEGFQWRFYLDLFEADTFRWMLFEIKEIGERTYDVAAPQVLTASRYPGLHADCARLAAEYLDFARAHLPDRPTVIAA